ncbi:MAG TPA: DUF1564 family protein, partial [Leptospiraceae bacterium]|nr:DUF1564 family protein [Leptospiraceae bacterium]
TTYNEFLSEFRKYLYEKFAGFQIESHKNASSISSQKIVFPHEDFKYSEFSSTLLIPERYYEIFRRGCWQHGGTRGYVAYLLYKYQLFIANGLVPGYSKVTTKYQEKGQNLHKVAFRPRPEDWAELKLYRVSFGMSISAFLVYLLIADSVDFAEAVSYYLTAVGISSIPNFDLCAKIFLTNNRSDYTIFFQFRKSKYG